MHFEPRFLSPFHLAALSIALILAGCGGDGGADSGSSGAKVTGAVTPTPTSTSTTTGVFVPPPTCVNIATLPTWRQGMAIGQWKQLASADISQVTPTVVPGGITGYRARIEAWNGFAADVVNNVLYLGATGGHTDYAGNEVYTLDLNLATPQWVIRQQPSPASAYLDDKPYYSDGRPTSTHTYYTAWFIEQRAKFFKFSGGATWGPTGGGGTPHIDSWDPVTNAWDAAGTNPDMGLSPTVESPTAKNFLTGDVYQLLFNDHLYRWNQQTNSVTDLGDAEAGGHTFYDFNKSPSVVDTKNNRLLFLSDVAHAGAARVYNLSAKTWASQNITGPAASEVSKAESQGMAYFDSCADKIVYKSTSGGMVYLVDPTTLNATILPTSGAAIPDPPTGVHTLFQYLPKLGGYAYQPTHGSKLYFLATQ